MKLRKTSFPAFKNPKLPSTRGLFVFSPFLVLSLFGSIKQVLERKIELGSWRAACWQKVFMYCVAVVKKGKGVNRRTKLVLDHALSDELSLKRCNSCKPALRPWQCYTSKTHPTSHPVRSSQPNQLRWLFWRKLAACRNLAYKTSRPADDHEVRSRPCAYLFCTHLSSMSSFTAKIIGVHERRCEVVAL